MSDIRLEVYDRDGVVVLADMRDHSYIFEPGQAVEIGNALFRAAQACGVEIEVQVAPRTITEPQRMVLIQRAELIMNSGAKQKRSPKWTAMQIVDSLLAELL